MSGETGYYAPNVGMEGIAEARLSSANLVHNLNVLRSHAPGDMMAMVKADAYGHGLVETAVRTVRAGAEWIGVATLAEALDLYHRGGITETPIMVVFFLPTQTQQLRAAIEAGVNLGVSSVEQAEAAAEQARLAGRRVRFHWKVDTGTTRGGSPEVDWPLLGEKLYELEREGVAEIVAQWSHLARAEELGEANEYQKAAFARAWDVAKGIGLEPRLRHFANSAAILGDPETHFDLTRPGIALFGSNPIPGHDADLRPVMELRSRVSIVKRNPAGAGVGYGHTHRLDRDTTTALVPIGYADGIHRASSGSGRVWLRGEIRPVIGRVSMDQVIVDCGDDEVRAGDEVVFFGFSDDTPSADDWARWSGTIGNEIYTGIGTRVPRRWID
ncbi:alanine racemase [Salininema proteolyticum]|uniref:Alanine racemase n=1 Tax=Salininema proteolyticum TaxID=1607685 RepID=A0ABV8TTE9_9ACTN